MWRCLAIFLLIAAPAIAEHEAPSLLLWAWERPEDLRFLDPARAGVAYLARTVFLSAGETRIRPRLQPLLLAKNTFVCAVIRIESDGSAHNTRQRDAVVQTVLSLAAKSNVSAIQVDFDAATSERAFYAELLSRIHHSMPRNKPLSVTALASWCLGDRWMVQLPIQEAVPMLFRMGPDGAQILRQLHNGGDFNDPLCRTSVGISTDEPGAPTFSGRRVYAFHPEPWTAEAVRLLTLRISGEKS